MILIPNTKTILRKFGAKENEKLTGLMDTDALLRKMRDQFANGLKGERNEK